MKKLIVLGIMTVCIFLVYQFPHAMINPGGLVEGHQKLKNKCVSCHTPFFGITNQKCISCHKLSDIGKDSLINDADVVNKKILFHEGLSKQKCTSCHTDHKGVYPETSLSRFHHNMLSQTVINNCKSCHGQPSDILHKQLATTCNSCHNTSSWESDVAFDHEMIINGAKDNCSSCHKKPEDDFHQQLTESCSKCHSTVQWEPSTFDHSEYFRLDGDHDVKCSTCHTGNDFTAFTCYSCHEHSEAKIREEHNEHGIYQFTKCASCHRSGDEDDIRENARVGSELDQTSSNAIKKYIDSKQKEKHKEKNKKEYDDD